MAPLRYFYEVCLKRNKYFVSERWQFVVSIQSWRNGRDYTANIDALNPTAFSRVPFPKCNSDVIFTTKRCTQKIYVL